MQQVVNGFQLGFVYALIALGYTMVYGIVRLINFAHGDVFMVGAFASYYAIARFGLNIWPSKVLPGLPVWLSSAIGVITVILISMVTCALMAFTIERIAYKPLRNAPRISALITAIGVSFFLEYFGALPIAFGPNFVTYQRPFEVVNWVISSYGDRSVATRRSAARQHADPLEYFPLHYHHFTFAFVPLELHRAAYARRQSHARHRL